MSWNNELWLCFECEAQLTLSEVEQGKCGSCGTVMDVEEDEDIESTKPDPTAMNLEFQNPNQLTIFDCGA